MSTTQPSVEKTQLPNKMEVLTVEDINAHVQNLCMRLSRYAQTKLSNGEMTGSRGISLAITKLEEADMWLQKELAMRDVHNKTVESLKAAQSGTDFKPLIITGDAPPINGSN